MRGFRTSIGLASLALSLVLVVFPDSMVVFAGGTPPSSSLIPRQAKSETPAIEGCNFATGDLHFDCIPRYIGYLIKFAVGMAAGFFLTGILIGGYKYAMGSVTAEGKEGGKKQLTGAILGFVVVILSYLLVDTIIATLAS